MSEEIHLDEQDNLSREGEDSKNDSDWNSSLEFNKIYDMKSIQNLLSSSKFNSVKLGPLPGPKVNFIISLIKFFNLIFID